MAGAHQPITLEYDDADVREALKKLQDKIGNLEPFYKDIGEALLNSTRERFEGQIAPDGSAWAALSPNTKKKKNQDKILILDGYLFGTLNYQATPEELLIGTPLEYGATHQFGRDNIPARPFLGISDADADDIMSALSDWLSESES